jgi:signal transduction histidine kinase
MQNLINNRWIRWFMPPLLAVGIYTILVIWNYFELRGLSFYDVLGSVLFFYFIWESGKLVRKKINTKKVFPFSPILRSLFELSIHLGIHLIILLPLYLSLKYFLIQYNNQNVSLSIDHFVFASIEISTITILVFVLQNSLLYIDRWLASALETNKMIKEREIQLLEAVMIGEEKERGRIAKDLHDGVAGMLAASKIYFTSIQSKNSFLNESKEFQHSLQLIDEAAKEIRKTAHDLVPEVLLQYGLDEALGKYCQTLGPASIEYYSINSSRLDPKLELPIYRIVQELLQHMIKHIKANQILVQLSQQQTMLSITIENNGVGTDLSKATNCSVFDSIRSRLQSLNGSIEWESNDEGGNVYLEFDVGYWGF